MSITSTNTMFGGGGGGGKLMLFGSVTALIALAFSGKSYVDDRFDRYDYKRRAQEAAKGSEAKGKQRPSGNRCLLPYIVSWRGESAVLLFFSGCEKMDG